MAFINLAFPDARSDNGPIPRHVEGEAIAYCSTQSRWSRITAPLPTLKCMGGFRSAELGPQRACWPLSRVLRNMRTGAQRCQGLCLRVQPRLMRPSRRSPPHWQIDRSHAGASDTMSLSGEPGGSEPYPEVTVFPRLKEKDPFKVLGIPSDSDFEEVQSARNYLVSEFRGHERSREHIELAYEQVVSQSFRARRKLGFRPARGKRGERIFYDAPAGILGRVMGLFDPSVTLATAARDLIMFAALGIWSAMSVAHGNNKAAILVMFGYAVFRTTRKRTIRKPDGPYFGGSPVWGALLLNVLCWLVAGAGADAVARLVPFWTWGISSGRASCFLHALFLCPLNIFLK